LKAKLYRRFVAEWDDVRRIALALPEASERPAYGNTAWRVRDKIFVWERPLRPKEASDLGERAPSGPILAVWVEDLGVKEALSELIVEAWLCRAPKRLAKEYLEN
jgi:hypothetical protein